MRDRLHFSNHGSQPRGPRALHLYHPRLVYDVSQRGFYHAPPTTIGTAGTTRSFCFKAFDGAPVWTRAELKALKEAGEALGLTVKLPTNRATPTLTTYPMT